MPRSRMQLEGFTGLKLDQSDRGCRGRTAGIRGRGHGQPPGLGIGRSQTLTHAMVPRHRLEHRRPAGGSASRKSAVDHLQRNTDLHPLNRTMQDRSADATRCHSAPAKANRMQSASGSGFPHDPSRQDMKTSPCTRATNGAFGH